MYEVTKYELKNVFCFYEVQDKQTNFETESRKQVEELCRKNNNLFSEEIIESKVKQLENYRQQRLKNSKKEVSLLPLEVKSQPVENLNDEMERELIYFYNAVKISQDVCKDSDVKVVQNYINV